jgi:ribosome recycling factor
MGDTYKEVRTFHYTNAVVRVHIPDLTEEERNRRLDAVKKAAAALLASSMAIPSKENKTPKE